SKTAGRAGDSRDHNPANRPRTELTHPTRCAQRCERLAPEAHHVRLTVALPHVFLLPDIEVRAAFPQPVRRRMLGREHDASAPAQYARELAEAGRAIVDMVDDSGLTTSSKSASSNGSGLLRSA